MARQSPPRREVVLRLGAALAGGYGFAWGVMSLAIAALFAAGMHLHDAQSLAAMIGFLVFATVVLWAFAADSPGVVWAVLVGGGLLMAGAASLLQSAVVG